MKHLALFCTMLSACSKSDDSGSGITNPPAMAPNKISASRIDINNLNYSSEPAGQALYSTYAQIYSGNVLPATTQDVSFSTTLPARVEFINPSTFVYINQAFDLNFTGRGPNGAVDPGSVHLELKNYSTAQYPQPTELFYSTGEAMQGSFT